MKIAKIKKHRYKGKVYNFHCLPDENYFGNNLLVHNCYKSNTNCGTNMSLETFKIVFDKINKNKICTQIALGIGDIDSNPDLWNIMEYCRSNGVIPNITTNGMGVTKEIAERLVSLCGAVSVSRYHLLDICYDTVNKLTDAGLKQCNIHQLLALETYDSCLKLLEDVKSDDRLSGLNAIVFLMLKPKGNRNKFHVLNDIDKFYRLINTAQDLGVSIGMDSCTAPLMLQYAITHGQQAIIPSVEPCESGIFSVYCDVYGRVWPCSFCEDMDGFDPIDITKVDNFINDVWFSKQMNTWRKKLLQSSSGCNVCEAKKYCRSCPVFDITTCRSL
jgi:radical SAM protein with 4Fe4S-binding SPASM domain